VLAHFLGEPRALVGGQTHLFLDDLLVLGRECRLPVEVWLLRRSLLPLSLCPGGDGAVLSFLVTETSLLVAFLLSLALMLHAQTSRVLGDEGLDGVVVVWVQGEVVIESVDVWKVGFPYV
jgi:hypothetical protein